MYSKTATFDIYNYDVKEVTASFHLHQQWFVDGTFLIWQLFDTPGSVARR